MEFDRRRSVSRVSGSLAQRGTHCHRKSKVKLHSAGNVPGRRELYRSKLALLGNLKDSVRRVLDVQLKADGMALLRKEIHAKIKVGHKVLGQSHVNVASIRACQRRRRAASVLERSACPEARPSLVPCQTRHSRVNLIEGRRTALSGRDVLDRESSGDRPGLKRTLSGI